MNVSRRKERAGAASFLCLLPLLLLPLLLLPLAGGGSGAAEEQAPPRLLVVVRCGKLAREEVSPGPRSAAQAFWKAALAGVTLAQLEAATASHPGAPAGGPGDLELLELWSQLFPGEARADGRGAAACDLAEPPPAEAPQATPLAGGAPAGEPPAPLRNLHGRFRAPPPPSAEEIAAVSHLKAAVSAVASAGAPASPAAGPSEGEKLAALGQAEVALARVAASGEGEASIRGRDELLARLLATARDGDYVVILSVPASGPGTLVARGPGLKAGRVLTEKRGWPLVAALCQRLHSLRNQGSAGTGREAAGNALEPIDELFKKE